MPQKPISLLHLTDLHYSSGVRLTDSKIQNPEEYEETPFDNLKSMLESLVGVGGFDAIAVSGDITSRGSDEGLTRFGADALPLLQKLVSSKKAVCIVPGNHDVAWNLDPGMANYFDRKFEAFSRMTLSADATTCLFPDKKATPSSKNGLIFRGSNPIFVDVRRKLLVMCINSSIRCGERDTDLHPAFEELRELKDFLHSQQGVAVAEVWTRKLEAILARTDGRKVLDICQVTMPQLAALQKRLFALRSELDRSWSEYVKIGVLHHHVTPFVSQQTEHKPFDIMNDAAHLLELFANFDFDIALTGHKHHSYVQRVLLKNREMLVVGGSTVGGAPASGTVPGIRHLSIDTSDQRPSLRITDLPCTKLVDVEKMLEAGQNDSVVYPIMRSLRASHRLWMFPSRVSATIEKTLDRSILKRDVQYEISVGKAKSRRRGLTLSISLTFGVENLSDRSVEWAVNYPFEKEKMGLIKKVFIDRVEQPLLNKGQITAAGLSLEIGLEKKSQRSVRIEAEEFVDVQGSIVFMNYCPTEGMSLKGTTGLKSVALGVEKLGPHDVDHKAKDGNRWIRVSTDDGLMPFQGFRLIWRQQNARG